MNLLVLMTLDQIDYYSRTSMPLTHVHVRNYALLQDFLVEMDYQNVITDYHVKDLTSNLDQYKSINRKSILPERGLPNGNKGGGGGGGGNKDGPLVAFDDDESFVLPKCKCVCECE